MKLLLKHFITINNKKYSYTLKPISKSTTFVECEAAKIGQEFPNEDIPNLLNDLPNLILSEKNYKNQQSEMIRFRVSTSDKKTIEKNAIQKGYKSVSVYLRDLALGNVKKF
ncbi:MAG: hypothetical protein RBS56_00520 [Candidatus Gracilibacteria bacterium]|jgi:hypothetical protein|nr:hypothetical protein [Candidatus Gracilibacteria bacterium]